MIARYGRPRYLRLACALLLATMLAGCPENPLGPGNGSGWNGRLFYANGGQLHVFGFAADTDSTLFPGGMPERIGADDLLHTDPANQRILFTSDDGTNQVVVDAAETQALFAPRMSPDRSMVAFTYVSVFKRLHPKDGTLVYDLSGRKIAAFNDYYGPSWSPTGLLILAGSYSDNGSFVRSSPHPGIFRADVTSQSTERIDSLGAVEPVMPAISPDGESIAFILNRELWIMRADGSGVRQLTAASPDKVQSFPTWSPDGGWIAFWSNGFFEGDATTAAGIVSSALALPATLADDAPVWPQTRLGERLIGGSGTMSWSQ